LGAGATCTGGSCAVGCCGGSCCAGFAVRSRGSELVACGTGLAWCGAESSGARATAGEGGVAGTGSAGGATAGFGESAFGGIALRPEEGSGSLPGAMLPGADLGFPCCWSTFGGV
jgi:hypothetical protein